MITKIDWYLIRKFLGTFFYAILIMAVIASVIDYSEKVKDFVEHKAPATAIMGYFKNFIPHIIALLFALFIFIATIFFTSKLAYKSEIIAILATGASFNRFLRPYCIGAGFLCVLFGLLNHYVVPAANKQRIAFENQYVHNAVNYSDRNVHLRLSPEQYVYVQNYDYGANTGYRFSAEKVKGTLLLEKIDADRISYDSVKKEWNLFNVTIRTNDNLKESFRELEHYVIRLPFTPKDLYEDVNVKETMTTPELNDFIKLETLRGRESLNIYYIEKYKRTAQPAAGFILCIIGVLISCRKVRGGSGFHLALGILVSAVYMLLLQLSTTFSTNADLPPLIAVWIPNIIFAIVALILYRRQVS